MGSNLNRASESKPVRANLPRLCSNELTLRLGLTKSECNVQLAGMPNATCTELAGRKVRMQRGYNLRTRPRLPLDLMRNPFHVQVPPSAAATAPVNLEVQPVPRASAPLAAATAPVNLEVQPVPRASAPPAAATAPVNLEVQPVPCASAPLAPVSAPVNLDAVPCASETLAPVSAPVNLAAPAGRSTISFLSVIQCRFCSRACPMPAKRVVKMI
ncbi:hypothetical protein KP509_1Z187500 [Ceratopteris richardii]|nr:hypothetical protein KP509_1Z187500 [Ceratopteris richardii]